MTEVTEGKPRTDHNGRPCPAWCNAAHDRGVNDHHGARAVAEVRREGTLGTRVRVSAHLPTTYPAAAQVIMASTRYEADPAAYLGNAQYCGHLQFTPGQSADFAYLVEALADLKPAQLRELAAAVRAAAAAIRGES